MPEPDQETGALIKLTVERTDGGIVDAELIRPKSFIKSHNIIAGKPLPLNIPELEVQGLAHGRLRTRCLVHYEKVSGF